MILDALVILLLWQWIKWKKYSELSISVKGTILKSNYEFCIVSVLYCKSLIRKKMHLTYQKAKKKTFISTQNASVILTYYIIAWRYLVFNCCIVLLHTVQGHFYIKRALKTFFLLAWFFLMWSTVYASENKKIHHF